MMLRRVLLFLLVACLPLGAQVKIHDPIVSLMAKPFGIGERIKLQSFDAVHCAPDGSKRLVFTLESAGVKQVTLRNPGFRFEIVLPNGKWASLGELHGSRITFPVTGDDKSVRRTYVAELRTQLTCADLSGYLRQAAAANAPVRLVGRATMTVGDPADPEFEKKKLKLELGGRVALGDGFFVKEHARADRLPEIGVR